MPLTDQRIAMVDMVSNYSQHLLIYRRGGGWSQSLPLKIVFSCSLCGGGRYFSAPRNLVHIVNLLQRSSFSTAGSFGMVVPYKGWDVAFESQYVCQSAACRDIELLWLPLFYILPYAIRTAIPRLPTRSCLQLLCC